LHADRSGWTARRFNPAAGGDLRIFPFGSPVPNASAINYIPQNIVANGIIQTICQGGSCGADITVHADANSTHLVADIVGYFQFPSTPITENLFAVVNAVAAPPTLVATQSFRATSVTRLGLGLYLVDFDRSVTNCAYSVTQGDPGVGSAPAGFVGVTGRAGDVNGLFIATYNSAAALTDRSFHVHVMCPPAP
jgi:hypothetical protein